MTLPLSRTQNNHDPQPEPDVETWQALLVDRGVDVGQYGIDGHYGTYTELATKRLQRSLGLPQTGVVDDRTYRAGVNADAKIAPAAHVADHLYDLVTGPGRPAYRFGSEVVLTDPHPKALDCSEAVQWAIFQTRGVDWVDGSYNQAARCRLVSVTAALKIKGALLFTSRNGRPDGVHHVAISMGNGMTAEARSTERGCGSWPASGRFNLAGLVPVLTY